MQYATNQYEGIDRRNHRHRPGTMATLIGRVARPLGARGRFPAIVVGSPACPGRDEWYRGRRPASLLTTAILRFRPAISIIVPATASPKTLQCRYELRVVCPTIGSWAMWQVRWPMRWHNRPAPAKWQCLALVRVPGMRIWRRVVPLDSRRLLIVGVGGLPWNRKN
jgi:hypothetical protein